MSINDKVTTFMIIILILASACGKAEPTALTTLPGNVGGTLSSETSATQTSQEFWDNPRSILTFDELMNGFETSSPVDEIALTMPENPAPPEHIFEGWLELDGEDTVGDIVVLRGDPNVEKEVPHLPEFSFEFIQSESYLVPIKRGLIITEHPYWNYIIEPGRVWQESDDRGYTRASFPFALVWKGSNATLNGVMTFLFNDETVSKVWYQVTQETTVSLSANLWGLLDATYHHTPLANGEQIRAAFAQELADRFPTKPIEQLALDFPEVDISAFGRGVSREHMTWYGLVINGVNYVGGCQTRYGTYPYCEYMRAPSYSTAKSAFVSVALMRLAQKYDPQVPEFLIKDYVPEAADSPGDWSKVTFNHTLDMATGNYRSSEFMVDEESWDTDPFWLSDYYPEIIAAAFNWPSSAPPGTQWVYRTSDTFIVTRAMHNYLQTILGLEADLFQFVVDEVYSPLKISPGSYSILRTKDNNWQGQPYGGLGMWWIPDDLAKISTLLNVDTGMINGEQSLHPDILAAALQHNPDDRGVDIDSNSKYNNAFWADHYSRGFDCEFWVPQMLGYSGIVVALFPNGATYYYASDHREFTWDAALREADKIISLCQPQTLSPSVPTGSLGDTWTRPSDGMTMVYVPEGTFPMGSTEAEIEDAISLCREHYNICNRWYYMRQSPQHSVSLAGFWLDQTEITNAQYRRCVEEGACVEPVTCKKGEPTYADAEKADHPVVCVSWDEAQSYCEWAGGRLPTEAEWEYAFRGERGSIYPWGDSFEGARLNYCDVNCDQPHADDSSNDGHSKTAPAGSYPEGASWCGVLNMGGNVSEWVADWLEAYSPEPQNNPQGPATGSEKMVKGCSWFFHPAYCRGATRPSVTPETRFDYLGFRCVVPKGAIL